MANEIVSGVNSIYEIMNADKRRIHRIWISEKHRGGFVQEILDKAFRLKIPVTKSTRHEIFNLSKIEKNQGIIAEVDRYRYVKVDEILAVGKDDPGGHFILVLDNILDPQNMGSIFRTAYLMGVHGVIIPERNSASVGPASTRAAAGAVEYLKIARVVNISRTLDQLKEAGVWVAGLELGGKNLYSHEFSGSYALVVGSEGSGIRRLVKEKCDELVSIPMEGLGGGVGSYNASVAAAILLSEVGRQRTHSKT